MKHSLIILLFISALGIRAASGQAFSIQWFTVNGSHGFSSGGAYSLSGILGQLEAGAPMTGGGFSVAGGVWSMAAVVASPDSPALRIQPDGANIILAWPNPSTGFELLESPSLVSPAWSTVPVVPSVIGAERQVILPQQPGHRFFRLRKP